MAHKSLNTFRKKDKNMTTNEEIIEGIILEADYGFGIKFKDIEHLYLKLRIQMFNGYECIQLFNKEKVGKILLQFKGDYRGEMSIQSLKFQKLYLLLSESVNGTPSAIAKLPPSEYLQYDWIYNDNWN